MKQTYTQASVSEITRVLVGHRIVATTEDTLTLDDGTVLKVTPNYGCGGCYSGWYEIADIDKFDQLITRVQIVDEAVIEKDADEKRVYSIFVYAGQKSTPHTVLEVSGDDGNGYYGTGYEIEVTPAD